MNDVRKVGAYLRARATEASTWAGAAAGSAVATAHYPHLAGPLGVAGLASAGIAFLLKEGGR